MNVFPELTDCCRVQIIKFGGNNLQDAQPAKPLKFGADDKLDFGGRFGRHRNPVMPDDRRENDVLNSIRASGPDFGKLGKFPHALDGNVRAGEENGQMEKPMQIAEPGVQNEEDQVLFLCVFNAFLAFSCGMNNGLQKV